jgi:hypothetical protein
MTISRPHRINSGLSKLLRVMNFSTFTGSAESAKFALDIRTNRHENTDMNSSQLRDNLVIISPIVQLCLVLVCFGQELASQIPPPENSRAKTSSLVGRITNQATDSAIADALIELVPDQSGVKRSTQTTDKDGNFVFDGLPDGLYRLVATKPGFVRQVFGYRPKSGTGTAIAVGAGKPRVEVSFTLIRNSSIQGSVHSESGQALEDVVVQAFERKYRLGRLELQLAGKQTITNDLGEYRIGNLAPGQYYIVALAPLKIQSSSTGPKSQGNGAEERSITTFYPNSLTPSSASLVNLLPGQDARGTDVKILHHRTYAIKGRVRFAANSQTVQNANIMVFPFDGEAVQPARMAYARSDTNGSFEIVGVPSGRYMIQTYFNGSGGNVMGLKETIVDNKGINDLTLELGGRDVSFSIKSSINNTVNSSSNPATSTPDITKIDLSRVRVNLFLPQMPSFSFTSNSLSKDGRITVENVPPGSYVLNVTGIPDGWFLKSATRAENEAYERDHLFQPQISDEAVSLSLDRASGSLSGTVQSQNGEKCNQALVFLVPLNKPYRYDLHKRAYADSNGRFNLTSIAPGEYYVYAWEDVESQAMFDSKLLTSFSGKSLKLQFDGNARNEVTLTAISVGEVDAYNALSK